MWGYIRLHTVTYEYVRFGPFLHTVTYEVTYGLNLTYGYILLHTVEYGKSRLHTVTYAKNTRQNKVTYGYIRLHTVKLLIHAVAKGHGPGPDLRARQAQPKSQCPKFLKKSKANRALVFQRTTGPRSGWGRAQQCQRQYWNTTRACLHCSVSTTRPSVTHEWLVIPLEILGWQMQSKRIEIPNLSIWTLHDTQPVEWLANKTRLPTKPCF